MHGNLFLTTMYMGVLRLKVLILINYTVQWHILTNSESTLLLHICIDSLPGYYMLVMKRKSLRDLIDRAIGVRLYTPPGSEHYKLLYLDWFHGSTHHQAPPNDKYTKKRWILYDYSDVYNLLHEYRAVKLADENSTTTYILLDHTRKVWSLVHLIPTVMHN